jgi:DNA-binding CsgD family transcriptional regulator
MVKPLMRLPVRTAAHAADMTALGHITPAHRLVLRDWERLRRRPASLRRASTWGTGPVDDLEQVVEVTLPDDPAADAVLHRLVAIALHDELATRVVLQRLLPDLARVHRRRRWQHWSDVDFGDLVATGWTVIRTYNTDRRPARLANALVSDIEYREYRAPLRRIGHGRPADPNRFDELVDGETIDPTAELAELVADAVAAGLSADDLHLIRQLANGRTTNDIADELSVTARTIRNRRERVTARLRDLALAA